MPKKDASKAIGRETCRQEPVGFPNGKSSTSGMSSCGRHEACILINTDEKGIVARVNRFGIAFLGKRETDILGREFAEIVLPDKFEFERRKKRFVDHFLYSPGKSDCAEFETRHASGHRRVAWTRTEIRDSQGVVEMLCLGIDIHEKTDAAPEAAENDEAHVCGPDSHHAVLERHIENSKIWAWETNADGTLCYASAGVEKLLGFSADELIGKGMDFIFPPNRKGCFHQAIDAARKNGNRHFKFESQVRRMNGDLPWFETAGVIFFDGSNNVAGARGINRDICQQMAAKEALALKEQEYRYLFDNTQVALMLLNEGGVILNINGAGAKMHGREPEEMIGREISRFLPESERRAAHESFRRSYRQAKAQKGNFVDIEPQMVRLDSHEGPSRYLRLVPKAIKIMENDQMAGILFTALDVTENNVLQKELERHQLQLQQMVDKRREEIQSLQEEMLRDERLATLGRLTSTVSHEIRNPLGTINSSLYVINERVKGKGFGVEPAIGRGFRAVRKCDGIIEEMLDFTRTKGLEKRTLDISAWLDRMVGEAGLPEYVRVEKRIEKGLSAPVDAARLKRCVSGILENSVTALQGIREGRIRISAGLSRGYIEISITDNGPGIPENIQKRVFDPLYSTKQNGIGMGLPVCKQTMELHGGSVRLRSDTNLGTTVVLRLPVPETA